MIQLTRIAVWRPLLWLGLLSLLLSSWAPELRAKTEEELIAELASGDASVVRSALGKLEGSYAASAKAQAAVKRLVRDSRPDVRRKAARVLGAMHAPVESSTVQDLCALLDGPTPDEVSDGLKALRGLKAPEAVPRIVATLRHPDGNVVRHACRTLAVLGNAEVIPALSVLLHNAEPEVTDEAKAAIRKLQAKR